MYICNVNISLDQTIGFLYEAIQLNQTTKRLLVFFILNIFQFINRQISHRNAKERKVRIWKDYVPKVQTISDLDRKFTGQVIQIVNSDAIAVKTSGSQVRTVHLSSVRPTR